MALLSLGQQYLIKYQLESTKVSIVSVSLFAGESHLGHFVLKNSSWLLRGLPRPFGLRSLGKTTGSSFSSTGTSPQNSQLMIGIGVPQYLCRLIPQSLSLVWVFFSPYPAFTTSLIIYSDASSTNSPLYFPEFIHLEFSLME